MCRRTAVWFARAVDHFGGVTEMVDHFGGVTEMVSTTRLRPKSTGCATSS
jgi:hypothetical protein